MAKIEKEYTLEDMLGSRDAKTGKRIYPAVTIGYRHYFQNACVRIQLGNGFFCVKDPTLSQSETNARIDALKALVAKPSRSKKVESTEDV